MLVSSYSLKQLLDLALCVPEIGAVNFNILHTVIKTILEVQGLESTRPYFHLDNPLVAKIALTKATVRVPKLKRSFSEESLHTRDNYKVLTVEKHPETDERKTEEAVIKDGDPGIEDSVIAHTTSPDNTSNVDQKVEKDTDQVITQSYYDSLTSGSGLESQQEKIIEDSEYSSLHGREAIWWAETNIRKRVDAIEEGLNQLCCETDKLADKIMELGAHSSSAYALTKRHLADKCKELKEELEQFNSRLEQKEKTEEQPAVEEKEEDADEVMAKLNIHAHMNMLMERSNELEYTVEEVKDQLKELLTSPLSEDIATLKKRVDDLENEIDSINSRERESYEQYPAAQYSSAQPSIYGLEEAYQPKPPPIRGKPKKDEAEEDEFAWLDMNLTTFKNVEEETAVETEKKSDAIDEEEEKLLKMITLGEKERHKTDTKKKDEDFDQIKQTKAPFEELVKPVDEKIPSEREKSIVEEEKIEPPEASDFSIEDEIEREKKKLLMAVKPPAEQPKVTETKRTAKAHSPTVGVGGRATPIAATRSEVEAPVVENVSHPKKDLTVGEMMTGEKLNIGQMNVAKGYFVKEDSPVIVDTKSPAQQKGKVHPATTETGGEADDEATQEDQKVKPVTEKVKTVKKKEKKAKDIVHAVGIIEEMKLKRRAQKDKAALKEIVGRSGAFKPKKVKRGRMTRRYSSDSEDDDYLEEYKKQKSAKVHAEKEVLTLDVLEEHMENIAIRLDTMMRHNNHELNHKIEKMEVTILETVQRTTNDLETQVQALHNILMTRDKNLNLQAEVTETLMKKIRMLQNLKADKHYLFQELACKAEAVDVHKKVDMSTFLTVVDSVMQNCNFMVLKIQDHEVMLRASLNDFQIELKKKLYHEDYEALQEPIINHINSLHHALKKLREATFPAFTEKSETRHAKRKSNALGMNKVPRYLMKNTRELSTIVNTLSGHDVSRPVFPIVKENKSKLEEDAEKVLEQNSFRGKTRYTGGAHTKTKPEFPHFPPIK